MQSLASLPLSAQSVNIPLADDANTSSLVIEADEGLEWIPKEGKYIARGNAKAIRGNVTLQAEELVAQLPRYRKRARGKRWFDLMRRGR